MRKQRPKQNYHKQKTKEQIKQKEKQNNENTTKMKECVALKLHTSSYHASHD